MHAILGMGPQEAIVVFGILVLLFGAAKIPALARSVGKSINEFKKGMNEGASGDPKTDERAEDKDKKE